MEPSGRQTAGIGNVIQIGVPPRRVDLMTSIDGVAFDAAWSNRLVVEVGDCLVPFLGRSDLLRNKREAGRPKDLLDIALLAEAEGDGSRQDRAGLRSTDP